MYYLHIGKLNRYLNIAYGPRHEVTDGDYNNRRRRFNCMGAFGSSPRLAAENAGYTVPDVVTIEALLRCCESSCRDLVVVCGQSDAGVFGCEIRSGSRVVERLANINADDLRAVENALRVHNRGGWDKLINTI